MPVAPILSYLSCKSRDSGATRRGGRRSSLVAEPRAAPALSRKHTTRCFAQEDRRLYNSTTRIRLGLPSSRSFSVASKLSFQRLSHALSTSQGTHMNVFTRVRHDGTRPRACRRSHDFNKHWGSTGDRRVRRMLLRRVCFRLFVDRLPAASTTCLFVSRESPRSNKGPRTDFYRYCLPLLLRRKCRAPLTRSPSPSTLASVDRL
jgi:hypothetical protein